MDVIEIAGFPTGIDRSGVDFEEPLDALEVLRNGYVYRQELKSRLGFSQFSSGRLAGNTRVMGIFENIHPDGTRESLIVDKKYLYTYNSGTNTYDQVAFTSADPIVDFGITNNEDYVSGTTYLTKTGTKRFVFTGKGMSDIYFYETAVGGVKRFTNAVDNPDYQAPAAGALTKATTVIWFGERLNFFSPVIASQVQAQAILYSAIRDSSGNGDKFNSPGAGTAVCDTYETMNGAVTNGDVVVMTFQRSTWVLEKTRDAFTPYFTRKVPSVLGTDAPFSGVAWNYEVKSIGQTGLLTTDARQSLRFDNRIPYLTQDEFDQEEFQLTYGGFDRINGQFLWAYRDTESQLTDLTQDRVLVYNYEFSTWAINDQRFSCFGQTVQGQNLTWSQIDETQDPSWLRWDTTEEIWNKIGVGAEIQKTLAGDNLGFIYQINTDYDDYFVAVSAISKASSAVATVAASAFQIGDNVIFENVEGMTEINGLECTVTAATTTSITVNIDSTNFTTYTGAGSLSKLIEFEAEFSPFNPYRKEGRQVYVSHVEVLLNTHGGGVYVDVYDDEEESPFKTSHLVPSDDTTSAREWITFIVDQESNFMTFLFRNNSAGNQTIITSIRIHCSRGAFTDG